MRPRSRRLAAAYVTRRALVAELLEERPRCQRCEQARSVDVHELVRRSQGGSILDERNLLAVCRPCHDWIGRNPTAAVAEGVARWGMRTNPEDAA